MNKDIIFVEVVVVLIFLVVANFFYSSKMTNLTMENYQFQFEKMSSLLDGCMGAGSNKIVVDADGGPILKKIQKLENQISVLTESKSPVAKAKEESSVAGNTIEPMKQNIKNVGVVIDQMDIAPEKINELNDVLRSMYKELGDLDLSVSKMVKGESVYRKKIAQKEAELQSKIHQIKGIFKQNKELKVELDKLSGKITNMENKHEKARQAEKKKKKLGHRLNSLESKINKLISKRRGFEEEILANK
ncbi:MAG: hypothetical protein GY858_01835 [Candidatus Omnitrophica bacterium]|nr:hypothetical protein [Candidatus Omnitrophota bacterium]